MVYDMELKLEPKNTALVIIDLQKGIVQGRSLQPLSGEEVVRNAVKLINASRKAGLFIVPVHVGTKDGRDMLSVTSETGRRTGSMPPDWADLVPELGVIDSDHVILKHNWSAFYGTDLDLQLRRRKIDTIILCGISTNIGVESTARDAYHNNYNQVFAIDAMSASSKEEHESTVTSIFPRIGTRAVTDEIITSIVK